MDDGLHYTRPRSFRSVVRWIEIALLATVYGQRRVAALAYQLGLQPHATLKTFEFAINAPPGRPPLRVGFASDFHAGPETHTPVILEACRLLREAQPDVLLLGGDFVSYHERAIDPVVDAISQIRAPLGRFAVLGNHDYWAYHPLIASKLQQAGIQLLINSNQRLAPPYDDIWVCGLDDPEEGMPDARKALEGTGPHRIVVMHSPDGVLALGDEPFTLALCGHTHGGQIALPGGRPLVLPHGQLCATYPAGRFELDGETTRVLLVSRGVGYSGLPVRLFAPPDVMMCVVGR